MKYTLTVAPMGAGRVPVKESLIVASTGDEGLIMTWELANWKNNAQAEFTPEDLVADFEARYAASSQRRPFNVARARAGMERLCALGLAKEKP